MTLTNEVTNELTNANELTTCANELTTGASEH